MSNPSFQPNDPAMTEEEREVHLGFMREALAMAQLALDTSETPVGCVFVHEGKVIGRGMNATNRTFNGTRHAEFMAISSILSQTIPSQNKDDGERKRGEKRYGPEILKECDLYVTVEPCIMCASLLRQFGIRRVFFGAANEKFGGTGGVLSIHQSNGAPLPTSSPPTYPASSLSFEKESEEKDSRIKDEHRRKRGDYEVSGGWLREEAILMLRRFYVQENGRAPEPRRRGKEGRVVSEEVG